jgi:hypothetical protein
MGFTVYYRSTEPLRPPDADAIREACGAANEGKTWLSCEPVVFFPDADDGHLFGGSKPNFLPHPDDVQSAATEGLPDGTTRDMLDILCRVSRERGVNWEISHDHSDGPIGYIRSGECDPAVVEQIEAFADLGEMLGNDLDSFL